ncbi:MAG: FecR family protein [Nitrosomonas sp.]|nr:FecR family protein [Nitrosomonas sp.]MBP6075311.1 FecR family protein [Nitrosomonas sp.]
MEKSGQAQQQQSFEQDPLTEQAAAWFLRMQQSDCSDADQRAFEDWLAKDEAHCNEYQQYVRLWQSLDQLERKPSRSANRKSRLTVAWIILLIMVSGSMHWLAHYEELITTAIGERHRIVLNDGTTIDMNTDTVLRMELLGLTRRITIEQGEALFKMGDERFRPFIVHSGNGTLRDIGTEFNVVRRENKTTVAVLEGLVEVKLDNPASAMKMLQGGQQLSYSQNEISNISQIDTESVIAWRKSRLIFRDTPLNEVIHQINRYHLRPIRLGDSQLSELTVSGEFNSADRNGLIRALKVLFSLSSSELDDTTVLYTEK